MNGSVCILFEQIHFFPAKRSVTRTSAAIWALCTAPQTQIEKHEAEAFLYHCDYFLHATTFCLVIFFIIIISSVRILLAVQSCKCNIIQSVLVAAANLILEHKVTLIDNRTTTCEFAICRSVSFHGLLLWWSHSL